MYKKCSLCGKTKQVNEFYKNLSCKDEKNSICKICTNQSIQKSKEKITNENKLLSLEDIYLRFGKLTKTCTECRKDHLLTEYHRCNQNTTGLKSKCKSCHKKYRINNPERYKLLEKQRHQKRKQEPDYKAKRNDQAKKRRKNSLQIRIKESLRVSVNGAIQRGYKSQKTMELVGCDINFLMKHLESQFEPWMSFQNYGRPKYEGQRVWEIDHITPCEFYNLEDPEQQKICFNWKNLRPLCAEENRIKNDWVEIDGEMVRARTLKKKNPTD